MTIMEKKKKKAEKRSCLKAKAENSDGPMMHTGQRKKKKVQKSMTESEVQLVHIIYRYDGEQAIESMGEIPPLTY